MKRHTRYPDDCLWTVSEVANELKVSSQAVYQWIKEGQIDYVPYGREEDRMLVPESVVQKFSQRRAEIERLKARIRDA